MTDHRIGRADGMPSGVDDVRAELDRLRDSLEPRHHLDDLGRPSLLPFKVAALRQLLLHRLVDLSEEALRLLANGSGVAGTVLARAAMETTAVLAALQRLVTDTVTTGAAPDLDERIMQLLFGSRAADAAEKAVNVLTQIEKLDAKYPGVRVLYAELSEVTHPNYMGLLGTYGDLDSTTDVVAFGLNPDAKTFATFRAFPALRASIEMANRISLAIAEDLEQFSRLCHSLPPPDSGTPCSDA